MLIPMRYRKQPPQLDPGTAEEIRLAMRFLGLPTYRQALHGLQAELRRARRYQHPLSVVALSPAGDAADEAPVEAETPPPGAVRTPHLSFYLLGSLLRDVLRETDVATYAAEQHLFAVFLLETREPEARCAVTRLRDLFHHHTGAQLRAGVAEFPRDGLTVEDLFGEARRAWEERPLVVAPRPAPVPEVKNA